MDQGSMASRLGRTCKQRKASLIAGLAFLLLAFSSAFAFAPTVSPSVSTDGSYSVTYPDQVSGPMTWLEERVGTNGVWTPIFTVSPVLFTGKAPGTYYYRTVSFWFELICGPYECSGVIEHYDVSDAVSVTVIANAPPLDSHEQQTQYQYEFRRGDLDGDGLADLHIKRVSGGVSGNGVLEKTILRGNGVGGFTVEAANSTSFAIADGWPTISVKHAIEDINLDGYVDIVVKNIAPLFANTNDQIVFSSGQPFMGQAQRSTSIDSNVAKFFRDVHAWMFDPAYFDQAITPSAIGYDVKIYRWLEVCDYYLGCHSGPYMQPVELGTFTLAQLGLSSSIDSNAKRVAARQAIAGQAAAVDCYYQDWNCNPWCGWIYHGWGSGYEFFWWVDEWAQTVVPGETFDSVNFSSQAYDLTRIIETIISGSDWILVSGSPAAQVINDILTDILQDAYYEEVLIHTGTVAMPEQQEGVDGTEPWLAQARGQTLMDWLANMATNHTEVPPANQDWRYLTWREKQMAQVENGMGIKNIDEVRVYNRQWFFLYRQVSSPNGHIYISPDNVVNLPWKEDYAPGNSQSDYIHRSILVHELMHVYQHRTMGWSTFGKVMRAIVGVGDYCYENANQTFFQYKMEEQAEMVQDRYLLKHGITTYRKQCNSNVTVNQLDAVIPFPFIPIHTP